MLLQLLYLFLFLSLDVLLYLRLVKKNTKSELWLIIVVGVWIIALVADLPTFHLVHLMPIKGFLNLSGMILMLLVAHFVLRFIAWALERYVTDDLKESLNSIMFWMETSLFAFFFIIHLFIIIVAYHG
jgi:hypothetical protein